MVVRSAVKRAVNLTGYDVVRYRRPLRDRRRVLMRELEVVTVVDVGANVGQYAKELRRSGFDGAIVSYEPIAQVFAILAARSRRDERWSAVQAAASSTTGRESINVSRNTASSSLLDITDSCVRGAPETEYVRREDIDTVRLDESEAVAQAIGPLSLKIDVQGLEGLVIAGASGVLDKIVMIEMELTVRELYVGQVLLPRMVSDLGELGFHLEKLEPGYVDRQTGDIMQFDGVFVRDPGWVAR